MYNRGIFPLHNRFLVTAEFLLDFYNTLSLNSSTIEAIKKKLYLLGLCEGVSHLLNKNIVNLCNDLQGLCISTIALLITPADLDHVICMVCGVCPKAINTDGNAKDTIKKTTNMVYEYADTSSPPDLESFKQELIQQTFKKSFFQNEPPKNYQMLKLPLIIAPGLLRRQTNHDIKVNISLVLGNRDFTFT